MELPGYLVRSHFKKQTKIHCLGGWRDGLEVQFPAHTWHFTTTCSFRGSDAFFWPPLHQAHMCCINIHAGKHGYTYNKSKNHILKSILGSWAVVADAFKKKKQQQQHIWDCETRRPSECHFRFGRLGSPGSSQGLASIRPGWTFGRLAGRAQNSLEGTLSPFTEVY